MFLVHKSCGGEVREDHSVHYDYEREDGKVEMILVLRCTRCGVEIEGDFQLEDLDGIAIATEFGYGEGAVGD